MKKKLLLIRPKSFSIIYSNMKFISYLTKKKGGMLNVGLAVIAALTPSEFKVKIIDENLEPVNFDEYYDMVGITAEFPNQLVRVKQIADKFRHRGILVVCGGPSVSVSPERWKEFADVLIIGEAERIWPQFINDYLNGSHRDEYLEVERFELTNTPIPDFSGITPEIINQYFCGIVQTSRGCPFDCEFCNAIVYVGRKMRYKSPDKVLQEVEQLYKMGFRIMFIADDNFSASRANAKKILKALRDWNRTLKAPMTFTAEVSIDIAKDEEFLELATEAGLKSVLIGIETPNVKSLKETGKLQNVETNMIEDVKKFHQHGIMITGTCVVGFDNDDLSIFQKQFDFFSKTGIAQVAVVTLQALDGTRLKERMVKEGRYVEWENACTKNPEYANHFNTFTIIPKQMTINQLQQGTFWLYWKLNNPINYANRIKIFFEDFENSPIKNKIKIPKPRFGEISLGIIWRFFKYYLIDASKEEKAALWQMFGYAWNSKLIHRFEIVISTFLASKNAREMIIIEEPQIDKISYPVQEHDALSKQKVIS